jgi:hypothetical protein
MKPGLVNPTCKKTTFISILSAISQIGSGELGDGITVVFTIHKLSIVLAWHLQALYIPT